MDGTMLNKEDCETAKEVVSKFGVQMVCAEEEEKPDVVLPGGADCENTKQVASKFGVQVLCDEEK